MHTVFFTVCEMYFRPVLSKRWIQRENYVESHNCDVHSCSAENVIRNPDCQAIKAKRTQNENTVYSG